MGVQSIYLSPENSYHITCSCYMMRSAEAREHMGHQADATTPSPPYSELPGGHVEMAPQTGPLPRDSFPDQMLVALPRMTSDSMITNCPNTCRLDIINPASFCSWRAADTASSRSIWRCQYPGGRLSRHTDSGARHTPKPAGDVIVAHMPDILQSCVRGIIRSHSILTPRTVTPAHCPRRVE